MAPGILLLAGTLEPAAALPDSAATATAATEDLDEIHTAQALPGFLAIVMHRPDATTMAPERVAQAQGMGTGTSTTAQRGLRLTDPASARPLPTTATSEAPRTHKIVAQTAMASRARRTEIRAALKGGKTAAGLNAGKVAVGLKVGKIEAVLKVGRIEAILKAGKIAAAPKAGRIEAGLKAGKTVAAVKIAAPAASEARKTAGLAGLKTPSIATRASLKAPQLARVQIFPKEKEK